MPIIQILWKPGEVLTDATSVKLSSLDASFGVRRVDTEAVVVADGVDMDNPSTGTYEYDLGDIPVQYEYYIEVVYLGTTWRYQGFADPNSSTAIDYTWGGASADSYVSLTDAEALINAYVTNTIIWDDGTDEAKNAALRMATRDVDSLQYFGTRYDVEQRLEFPRAIDFKYGFGVDVQEDKVKEDIQLATALQASYLLTSGKTHNYHASNIAAGLKQVSESVGPIRDQYTYESGGIPTPLCPQAFRLLQKYRESKRIFRA